MAKLMFWKNVLTGLKGFSIDLLSSVVLLIAWVLGLFISGLNVILGLIVPLALLVLYFFVWGWIANKLYKWK